jgi:hypothetical protein
VDEKIQEIRRLVAFILSLVPDDKKSEVSDALVRICALNCEIEVEDGNMQFTGS